jgi:hypothetical protein
MSEDASQINPPATGKRGRRKKESLDLDDPRLAEIGPIRGYEDAHRAAKILNCSVDDLRVLARGNDPFTTGTRAEVRDAEWFAELYRRFGIPAGVHLRFIHYTLVSQPEPYRMARPIEPGRGILEWNYLNTSECSSYLEHASKCARHLGLVEADDFDDHRAPPPLLFADYSGDGDREPGWIATSPREGWVFPQISHNLDQIFRLGLPVPEVVGYGYDLRDEDYHLEFWIEKSTQNRWLEPLCRELNMNLVVGVGFMSITGTINLLQRVQQLQHLAERGKLVRVFYGSDFDPGGESMPIAVSRQCEFYKQRFAPDVQIKINPLVLTKEQCVEYDLPTIPIKDGDRRKANFQDRHGEGATELDAMEALRPGEMAKIIRATVEEYRDEDFPERLGEAESRAKEVVKITWEEATAPHRETLARVEEAVNEVAAEFRPQVEKLQADLAAAMAPVEALLKIAWHPMQKIVDDFSPDLPERPTPDIDEPDEGDWLFDSEREWHEQLAAYRDHKSKPAKKGGGV